MRPHAARWCVFVAFLVENWRSCDLFNVDISSAKVFMGDKRTAFGFSIALYKRGKDRRVIVGAPESEIFSRKNAKKQGAVYACHPDEEKCRLLAFDGPGIDKKTVNETEDRSEQWLGATVAAGKNGVIVACAPRYVYILGADKRKFMIGQCYVSHDLSSVPKAKVLLPCKDDVKNGREKDSQQHHEQGMCQAGFSAAVSLQDERLMLGAVGSWYWQGQLFNYAIDPSRPIRFLKSDKWEQYDELRGYSIAVGKFDSHNIDCYSVGSPKAANLLGKVTVMNQGFGEAASFIGKQVGAFFGYSQAVGDFDGDGNDDLAVGAPFYANLSYSSHDQGRVFIFYQLQRQFRRYKSSFIAGGDTSGHFGQALSSLGDVNKDTFDDLCVGAPYDGDNGRGVVYVYHGSKDGVLTQPSQKITAESISPGIRSFGFSLASGQDMDDNTFPDMAVGAYDSDVVVYLRSRPIVYTTSTLKSHPDRIRLKDISCKLADNTYTVCFQVVFCLEYFGLRVPKNYGFNITISVDSGQAVPRAYMRDNNSKPATLSQVYTFVKNEEKCHNVRVYMKRKLRDKLSDMTVDFGYELVHGGDSLTPILDQDLPKSRQIKLAIWKDCGKDKKCIPDLSATLKSAPKSYRYASGAKIPLELTVHNHLEAAYGARMVMSLPPVLSFINVELPRIISYLVSCRRAFNDTVEQVNCELGNPLPPLAEINMVINLQPKTRYFENVTEFNIDVILSSDNEEDSQTLIDNTLDITVPVVAEAAVSLRGVSFPEEVYYNKTHSSSHISLTHVYELQNTGHVGVYEGEVMVLMPAVEGSYASLVTLTQPDIINGTGDCRVVEATSQNTVLYRHLKPWKLKADDVRNTNYREVDTIACQNYQCPVVICSIHKLESGERFLFHITFQLSLDSIHSRSDSDHEIVSQGLGHVRSLYPHLRGLRPTRPAVLYNVTTSVTERDPTLPDTLPIPIWVIIVSVIVGILFIIVIIIILWRLGFFKRYSPPHKAVTVPPEEKPLWID